jgi:molybdate transport system ATP-binding protein
MTPTLGNLDLGWNFDVRAKVGALSLEVQVTTPNPMVILVGPNGAGKSTLVRALLGAESGSRGGHAHLTIAGHPLASPTSTVPVEMRGLGYVPQRDMVFPHMTALENVCFARQARGATLAPSDQRRDAERYLERVGLAACADRIAATLSGGERQRLSFARALASVPKALLLDEPLSAIDLPSRMALRTWLVEQVFALALPTLLVTHDPADARAFDGHIVVLEAGRISQQGSWATLCASPRTEFVRAYTRALLPADT